MSEEKKIFDDFIPVDCSKCEEWWLNKCDGVTVGSERHCTAFKATRREDIPQQLKSLRNALRWLYIFVILLAGTVSIYLVTHLIP